MSETTDSTSPFRTAQVLRILKDAGHEHPNREREGIAFTMSLLESGYDAQLVTQALENGLKAAGRAPASELYTLAIMDPLLHRAVRDFRDAVLNTLRPGASERKAAVQARIMRRGPDAGPLQHATIAELNQVLKEIDADADATRDLQAAAKQATATGRHSTW